MSGYWPLTHPLQVPGQWSMIDCDLWSQLCHHHSSQSWSPPCNYSNHFILTNLSDTDNHIQSTEYEMQNAIASTTFFICRHDAFFVFSFVLQLFAFQMIVCWCIHINNQCNVNDSELLGMEWQQDSRPTLETLTKLFRLEFSNSFQTINLFITTQVVQLNKCKLF